MGNLYVDVLPNRGISGLLKIVFSGEKVKEGLIKPSEIRSFFEAVEDAKKDLANIQELFNLTNDPDIIDYAIYEEHAIKLRYSYLMKKAKEKNIKNMNFTAV